MPHDITWIIPDYVIIATLKDAISADEVQTIADEIYEAVALVPQMSVVHILIDMRECTIQDKIWNYAKLNFRRNANNGWAIIIGDSRVGGLIIAIFSKALNLRIRYSDTPAAALQLLSEHFSIVADYLDHPPL